MITADKLALLTSFPTDMLKKLLGKKAENTEFVGCKFLGITNAGQFCYTVVYKVKEGTGSTKVFVSYDSASNKISADY